jgi:hypothetical protein
MRRWLVTAAIGGATLSASVLAALVLGACDTDFGEHFDESAEQSPAGAGASGQGGASGTGSGRNPEQCVECLVAECLSLSTPCLPQCVQAKNCRAACEPGDWACKDACLDQAGVTTCARAECASCS